MTNTANKRIFALFLALILAFAGISPIEVFAQGGQNVRLNGSNEDYSWTEKEDGTLEITYYNGTDSDVKIPSTILGKRVTSIGKFAFNYIDIITNVEIPESVMSIGNQAFTGCSNLMNVEIREGVRAIGSFAFSDCSSLINVEIAESVTDIGDSAFSYCKSLMNVKIPGSVMRIGKFAFAGCKSLKSAEMLGNATIIEEGVFAGCSSLTNMKIANGNENYILENGILYDKEKTKVVFCLGGTTGEVRILEGVANISDYAFSGCSMTHVKIAESVTNIGGDAFSYCDALKTIEIPKNVIFIGEGAFSYCNNLENAVISGNMVDIGSSAFRSCKKLANVEIREEVRDIGLFAFSDCSSLANLDLSKSVKSIGYGAFLGCSSLESVRIPDSVINIGDSAFSECSGLAKVEIPDSVENIGGGTFRECSSLKSIIIPKTVTSIGSSAFSGCSNLVNIEIREGVRVIGSSAFSNCSSLINVEIPKSVATIGSSAFYYCRNLKSIELPDSITEIKSNTFSNCNKLNNITIPESVVVIAKDAFQGINVRAVTIFCSNGSYAEQYARENNFAIQDIQGTPDQNPAETPGSGDTEEPGKEPPKNPGTEQPETPGQNPTETPGNSNIEEPGKEPTEKPGTETPGTPEQNPTEKPGNSSTEKPTVSPDGKTIQTITAEDIVKAMGDEPFYLDAETDGDGTLTYESKNPDIVKVDGTGKATIVSAGTAKISVTAPATDIYSSAIKTLTVTVIPEGYTPIEDIDDLYAIRNNPRGNYILVNDIDMSATQKGGDYDCGTGWDSIEKFSGTLDGNGHRIVGMHIFGEFKGWANVGLFEESFGSIINLGMVDCDIDIVVAGEGGSVGVGAISGEASFTEIKNCYSSGKIIVQGSSNHCYVGGVAGRVGEYENCYNMCELDCTRMECKESYEVCIGGLSGYTVHSAKYRQCYNVGNIQGNETLKIGAITTGVYYNCQNAKYLRGTAPQGIGGLTDNPNCVSLTETQMKNPKLFTGFDFTNTWEVDPYCSYPYPQLKNNRMVRINSIRLDTAPTKLTYNQGESLKLNGAALEISYEDGINTTIPLEKDMLSGYDMNKIGQQTVTVSYGGEETSFDIEVKEVQVSGISIPKTLSLDRSKQKQLTASITPANASDKSVTWESDNPGVASVSSSGLVKAKAKGKAVITATASNGVKASCTVTVLVPAVSVKLSQSSLSMAAGSRRSIKAQVLPLESTDSVSWKSSNKAVAEVYDGNILAIKEGTAKITAYTKSGAKASCTVTVKKSGNGASSEIKKITSQKAKIKSAKNVKKKSVKLKLSGSVNGSGYKIQYGTSRKFKGAKTVTAKGGTATIKKLKAKKTYYIRARIYKKISGRTYYGKWSSVKSVKIKK